MEFLNHDIRLAILDLDGTLFDSTGLWADIDTKFFARRGMEVPPGYGQSIVHIGLAAGAEYTQRLYLPNEDKDDILAEWNSMSQIAYEEEIPAKPYSKELLETLHDKGVLLTLATANNPSLYMPALKRLGLLAYFEFMADPTVCPSGKEGGALFHYVAEHYGLAPENILIVEDSLRPILAAKSGGYLTVGVYDEHSCSDIEKHQKECDLFCRDLQELIAAIE